MLDVTAMLNSTETPSAVKRELCTERLRGILRHLLDEGYTPEALLWAFHQLLNVLLRERGDDSRVEAVLTSYLELDRAGRDDARECSARLNTQVIALKRAGFRRHILLYALPTLFSDLCRHAGLEDDERLHCAQGVLDTVKASYRKIPYGTIPR